MLSGHSSMYFSFLFLNKNWNAMGFPCFSFYLKFLTWNLITIESTLYLRNDQGSENPKKEIRGLVFAHQRGTKRICLISKKMHSRCLTKLSGYFNYNFQVILKNWIILDQWSLEASMIFNLFAENSFNLLTMDRKSQKLSIPNN